MHQITAWIIKEERNFSEKKAKEGREDTYFEARRVGVKLISSPGRAGIWLEEVVLEELEFDGRKESWKYWNLAGEKIFRKSWLAKSPQMWTL